MSLLLKWFSYPAFDKFADMQEYLEKFMPQLPNFEQVQAKRRQQEEEQRRHQE